MQVLFYNSFSFIKLKMDNTNQQMDGATRNALSLLEDTVRDLQAD